MLFAILLISMMAPAIDATPPDNEAAVLVAALASYFNVTHGGTGVAFADARRPVLLHRATILPSTRQLSVRVSSPGNRDASQRYAAREVQALVERTRQRSRHSIAVPASPTGYLVSKAAFGPCGPKYDMAEFADAVAVSRAAIANGTVALVYLEYSGGARAYHVAKRDNRWSVDWFVELWACG